jgi:hypothetical protein
MSKRMIDIPYSAEAWHPETWVPMVPGCKCRPNPWAGYENTVLGRKCFRCHAEIRPVPSPDA